MRLEKKPVRVLDPTSGITICIVGIGGTGGYVVQQLARLVYAVNKLRENIHSSRPVRMVLVDGDVVEEGNLLRQYFLGVDLGRNKAVVLAKRYSLAYGIEIGAYPHYIDQQTQIFYTNGPMCLVKNGDIVVACVDNAATRAVLHDRLSNYEHIVYIDAGNAAARLPDQVDVQDRYDLAAYRQEAWDGQVVCGVRAHGRQIIPFVGEVLEDMITFDPADGSDLIPTDPRCGEVVVSQPQRLMTNLMAATSVMTYLHTLLSDGTIVNHRTFFDARSGWTRSDAAIDAMVEVGT